MEERASKLQDDISAMKLLANDCVYLQILECTLETVQLQLFNPLDETTSEDMSFNFCAADYPQGTCVSVLGSDSEPVIRSESKPLLELIATECHDWCRRCKLEMPAFAEEISRHKPKEAALSPSSDSEQQHQQYSTQSSVASSHYTDASDTDMEEDYDYGFDEISEEDSCVHPLLEVEISRVQHKFGHNSIESRIHAGIDEMDLFFKIDLNDFLDSYTGSAWGMNLEHPLIILLHIRSVSKYLDGVEPQVDVFQESQKVSGDKIKAGVAVQMKKIMERFVIAQWKTMNNSLLEEKVSAHASSVSKPGTEKRKNTLSIPVPKVQRQSSLGAQMSIFSSSSASEADKVVPSLENGFLVQFLQYALNRIQSLNEFCVICDERHVLETGLLKPCVCTRELCVFAFQTLGVMADAAEAIATDADVVDLLIAMANAAAQSTRNNLILDPFPSIVDPTNSARLALDPKNKDFDLVKKVLTDVVKCRGQVLRGRISNMRSAEGHHELSFPLMQWIIATCRAHIVLLPQERLLKSMKTKYQFLLISSPPKKEVAFREAKEKYGSTFAFHGSNIENWHSIMRKGLINATGTKYQLHGAAHGSGVYLSPDSNVSFGYTHSYRADKKVASSSGKKECLAGKLSLRCLALCEVVLKDLNKTSGGNIWVCPKPDYVCTRFFFVYDTSTSVSNSTITSSFRQEIDHAMAYIKAVRAVT